MTLQEKYAELLQNANTLGLTNFSASENAGVLEINGTAKNQSEYDALWALYNKIDPNMASGDLLMNIDVKADVGSKLKVSTDATSLNIRSTPSTDADIVAKAAHHDVVTLVEKTDDSWWKIRTHDGKEGYAFAQYLSPM